MPLIFFTTFYYILTQYEDNNELKIFWINGVDKRVFLQNVFKYSILFLIFQLVLSSFLVPTSQNKARTFIQNSNIEFYKKSKSLRRISKNLANDGFSNDFIGNAARSNNQSRAVEVNIKYK